MRHRITARLFSILALMFGFTGASLAGDYNCTVVDPAGDAFLSPGHGFDGEAFQDILVTGIERTTDEVVFSMTLAAPIPEVPRIKTGNGLMLWMWGMNTAPGVPKGFPLSPGLAGLLEFWIHLAWDGEDFYAEVIDRRPGTLGGEPIVTPVEFVISGDTISVIAPANLFDDPQEFRWGSSTWLWSTHLATAAAHVVDRAPDGPAATCTAN
jgi:hypothetical protein